MNDIYRRPTVVAGVAVVLVMAVTGIFAPFLSPHDPRAINERAFRCPPFSCELGSRSYILGADHLGRDVLSRIVTSFRTNLYIGLLGTFLGTLAAWLLVALRSLKGAAQAPDTSRPLFGIPLWGLAILTYCVSFLPSLIVVAAIGTSLVLTVVCAGVFASLLPMTLLYDSARRDHAAPDTITLPGSNLDYETVREDGLSSGPIWLAVRRGIVLAPVGFCLAFLMGLFIEFYLSFLGVGVPPDVPSLGNMVTAARGQIVTGWWMMVFPFAVGLVAAGAFSGIVFPVSRALSSAKVAWPDAFQALGIAPAGLMIRLAAQLIDLAAVIIVVALILIIIGIMDLPSAIAEAFRVALVMAICSLFVISPGKRAVGLRVLRLDGSSAGWGRKLFRYLVSLSTIYIIDLLMIALRKDRRALHDLICDTIVVRSRDLEHPSTPDAGAET